MKLRLKLLDDDGRTIATATIPLHDDDRYTGLDTPEDCRQALVGLAQQARRELGDWRHPHRHGGHRLYRHGGSHEGT